MELPTHLEVSIYGFKRTASIDIHFSSPEACYLSCTALQFFLYSTRGLPATLYIVRKTLRIFMLGFLQAACIHYMSLFLY